MREDSELAQEEQLCMCPLQGIIDTIGKKWPLLVINALGNHGRLRFKGLMRELRGISPRTLAEALKELEGLGLIEREQYKEIPPRVEYSLTQDGRELRRAVMPLIRWALARTDDRFKGCCGYAGPSPQGDSVGGCC